MEQGCSGNGNGIGGALGGIHQAARQAQAFPSANETKPTGGSQALQKITGHLRQQQDELASVLAVLEDRLAPVLLPEAPSTQGTGAPGTSLEASTLAYNLLEVARAIDESVRRVYRLVSRLDV